MKRQQWLKLALATSITLVPCFDMMSPVLAAHYNLSGQLDGMADAFRLEEVEAPVYGVQYALAAKRSGKAVTPSSGSRSASTLALQQGIENYNKNYIEKAIPLFEKAVSLSPDSEMANLWLGRSYKRQGTKTGFEKSRKTFEHLLALNSEQFEALASLGEILTWNPAERERGLSLLKKAYLQQPDNKHVSRSLVQALSWEGRYQEALQNAKPAIQGFSNDPAWLADYAQILAKVGQTEQAVVLFDSPVLKQQLQKDMTLQMRFAEVLRDHGDQKRAKAVFNQLAESSVSSKAADRDALINQVSDLAYQMNFYDDVLRLDNQLSTSAKRHQSVQMRDARALVKLFRNPEAIEQYQKLYDAGLLSAAEKLEYAEFLMQLNLPPEALPSPNLLEELSKGVMAEAEKNPIVTLRLARLYAAQPNQFEASVSTYKTVLDTVNPASYALVEKEFLDMLKASKDNSERVDAEFQELLKQQPESLSIQAAYAEFLSWNADRRVESLERYLKIAKRDKGHAKQWEAKIEEVLQWSAPSIEQIGLYRNIVDVYPNNKMVWLTIARAYGSDKKYLPEAVKTYAKLVKEYPGDRTVKKEWLALLLSDENNRTANLKLLNKMSQQSPVDEDIVATYGKLLSYSHHYDEALSQFDRVLQNSPSHRESLLGKGYTFLWSGRKFHAKKFFATLHQQYPDDVDIAIGLAQAQKQIGRYDEAIKIIQEIKPLMDKTGSQDGNSRQLGDSSMRLPEPYPAETVPAFVLVSNTLSDRQPRVVSDYMVAVLPDRSSDEGLSPVTDQSYSRVSHASQLGEAQEINDIQSEVDSLTAAVEALHMVQKSSRQQLDALGEEIQAAQQAVPHVTSLTSPDSSGDRRQAVFSSNESGTSVFGSAASGQMVGRESMEQIHGVYSSLDYDTNPLLSGVGRLKNDQLSDLESGLTNDLRPMFRAGFLYSTQDGEDTTTSLSSWGFPNQISFSLTPQVRLRGGIQPTRYYLPNGVSPDSSWGTRYGVGATVKYWDRLTLDGDVALTHFSQSESSNITFNAEARYDFNDSIRGKIGMSRLPQYTSLLTVTGLKPSQGAFRGDIIGQARENSLFAELNTNPFNHNWDWNLGYAWAFVDGSRVPTNYKNQAFTSLGHTWHYGAKQQVRAGYELLYFGYSKNATNGFFDTTSAGLRQPVSTLRPPTLSDRNYDFGGYYSPSVFFLNAMRLDFRGSLLDKFLEYKLGGSLGAQTVRLGNNIRGAGNSTTLSAAFDGNAIMNLTDWLALYGDVDYLDAGGQFNRWRFGGGLILRPHIKALSPVLGH